MNGRLLGIVFMVISLMGASVWAGKEIKKKRGVDLSFEDLLVQGKYHFANESVVTVEQDKAFEGMLKLRKDFDDRIQKSASKH